MRIGPQDLDAMQEVMNAIGSLAEESGHIVRSATVVLHTGLEVTLAYSDKYEEFEYQVAG